MNNQRTIGFFQLLFGILIIIGIFFWIFNSFKDYSKEDITEYNKWVAECNATMNSNQLIVNRNSNLMSGISFKPLKSIPTNIYETHSFSEAEKLIEKYKNENNANWDYNNRQVTLMNDIITRYNLMVTIFQ